MENIIINIDSKYRNKELYPNGGNFTITLDDPIKNITYIRLSSAEVPNIYHTFTNSKNNMSFYSYNYQIITVKNESYNIDTIITELQNAFPSTLQKYKLNIEYSYILIESDYAFVIKINENNINKLLGFKENEYNSIYNNITKKYNIKSDSPLENQFLNKSNNKSFIVESKLKIELTNIINILNNNPVDEMLIYNDTRINIYYIKNRIQIKSQQPFIILFNNNEVKNSLGFILNECKSNQENDVYVINSDYDLNTPITYTSILTIIFNEIITIKENFKLESNINYSNYKINKKLPHIIITNDSSFEICFKYEYDNSETLIDACCNDHDKKTLGNYLGFINNEYISIYDSITKKYYIKSDIPFENFNATNANNSIYIRLCSLYKKLKDEGFYKISSIINALNENTNTQLIINPHNGNVKIVSKELFKIDFSNTGIYPSLGHQLGFRKKIYLSIYNNSCNPENRYYYIKSEAPINVVGDSYIYLKVNDYGKIYSLKNQDNTLTQISYLGKIIVDVSKGLEIFDNNNFITKLHIFKQPENISKLCIKLLDSMNNIIDIPDINYSLTLEIGVIYDSILYQKYLNDSIYRYKLIKSL